MTKQFSISSDAAFTQSANPVGALLHFLQVCDLPGADELRAALLADDRFSIKTDGVEYTREFCDECGYKPGLHAESCSRAYTVPVEEWMSDALQARFVVVS